MVPIDILSFTRTRPVARTPKEITDAELTVLAALWERPRATVRELAEALYPDGGASQTATVQKLCERLEAKRCVARDKRERPATYRATIDRAALIGRHLRGVADRLCAGSFTPLLTHLVESGEISDADLQRLRERVANLDEGGAPPPREERE